MRGANRISTSRSRRLRRNSTDAERRIWSRLRDRQVGGFKFVRQEAIGAYIVDFRCREARIVIEIDGGQHAESASDQRRDAWLESAGYRVLRFWNNDVLANTEGILEAILTALGGQPLTPNPLPVNGEREGRK